MINNINQDVREKSLNEKARDELIDLRTSNISQKYSDASKYDNLSEHIINKVKSRRLTKLSSIRGDVNSKH